MSTDIGLSFPSVPGAGPSNRSSRRHSLERGGGISGASSNDGGSSSSKRERRNSNYADAADMIVDRFRNMYAAGSYGHSRGNSKSSSAQIARRERGAAAARRETPPSAVVRHERSFHHVPITPLAVVQKTPTYQPPKLRKVLYSGDYWSGPVHGKLPPNLSGGQGKRKQVGGVT